MLLVLRFVPKNSSNIGGWTQLLASEGICLIHINQFDHSIDWHFEGQTTYSGSQVFDVVKEGILMGMSKPPPNKDKEDSTT